MIVVGGILTLLAAGINLGPIVAVVIAVVGSSALTAALTLSSTNRKLRAEGDRLAQEALNAVEERGAQYVTTMDRIRSVLEQRLAATERDLAEAKRALEVMEERWRNAQLEVNIVKKERERVLAEAETEREKLRQRITDLEAQVDDLYAQLPGRRRRDPPRESDGDSGDGDDPAAV